MWGTSSEVGAWTTPPVALRPPAPEGPGPAGPGRGASDPPAPGSAGRIAKEMEYVKSIVEKTAQECKKEKNSDIKYSVGTMVETPRAALTADEIAESAEFFSFGTNDLTQMTFGFSRDDTGNLIRTYVDKGIFQDDIFR